MPDRDDTVGTLVRAAVEWSHWGKRLASLAVPVSLDVAARAVFPQLHSTTYHAAGVVVLVVACLIAAGLQARRLSAPVLVWAVPLLCLLAIGLMRLVPEPSGLAILVVLPAMWLGIDHRRRGVVVTGVAVLVLQTAPGLAYFGTGPGTWMASLQLCLVATLCALSLAWIADQWTRHEQELDRHRCQVEEAMTRLRANQALNEAVVGAVDVGLVALRRDGAYSSMNPHHKRFMALAYPDGHGGYAGQAGWVFEADGVTFLSRDGMPTVRAMNGEEFNDYLIWVGEDPAQRRALAVSARRVEGDSPLASVLVYKDVTELVRALAIKDEFLATVSHELRTPLTSILGYLDLTLLDTSERDPRRAHLVVAHRNARRLLRLVNDLLLTARSERGGLDLDRRVLELGDVVTECLDDMAGRARGADVRLDADVAAGLCVLGDRERLAQVVDNLVTNAVKYSPAGGCVRVTLRAAPSGRDGRELGDVVLTVADEGIGISEEDQRQLFTKFFRTQEAQQRAIQGMGLGLSITRAIVEGHEGSISVESELGEGTTFTVRLPAAAAPPDADLRPLAVRRGSLGGVRA